MKRILCLIFIFAVLISISAGGALISGATGTKSELSELEDLLAAASASRENAERALDNAEKNYADALAKKQAIDNKIYSLSVEIDAIVALINGYSEKINEKNLEIESEKQKLNEAYSVVRERIRAKREDGNIDVLALIFDAEGLTQLFTEIDRFMCMLEYDAKLLESYNSSIDELERLRFDLTQSKAKLDEQMKTLEQRKKDFEKAQKDAQKFVATSENKLATAERDLENVEAIEREYEKKREELLANLDKTTNQSYVGGEFIWPLPQNYTRVSSGFGWRIHPVTGKQQFHIGIDIPAPYGTEINAINDGVVVECSYNYADGYFITVSHGGGIASFYSHLSRYHVKVGDKVTKGQVIANVGTSGYTTGAHLNLNMYVDGSAVNPLDYVKP